MGKSNIALHIWYIGDELSYYDLCSDEVGYIHNGIDKYVVLDDII